MDFNFLLKFIKTTHLKRVSDYDISVYYNHRNVFYKNHNKRILINKGNTYSMYSGAKLVYCIATLMLVHGNKLSIDEPVNKYLTELQSIITVKDFIYEFYNSYTPDEETFNFANISELIKTISKQPADEFISDLILKPLKINATFVNDCLNITVKDCVKLCDVLCSDLSANKYQLFSNESIRTLVNSVLNKDSDSSGSLIINGYANDYILIDFDNNVVIVYAQSDKESSQSRIEVYNQIKWLTYDGIGVNSFSKGYNLFP